MAAVCVGCSSASDGTAKGASTTTAVTNEPTTTSTTTAPARTFDRSTYSELATSPDRFKGSSVDIVGKVFGGVSRQGAVVAFQMFADPKNSEWNTIVGYSDRTFTVNDGDFVHVIGTVKGSEQGQNALGGTVQAVLVLASKAEVVDALAAASPALRKAPGSAQSQHRVTVTVESVEFAADETRVLLAVENRSGQKANFYSFNVKATQGDKQFEPERFGTDYPEVQSELLPGVKSRGVVVFPPIPPGLTNFIFEVSLDDFTVDFAPFTFRVNGS